MRNDCKFLIGKDFCAHPFKSDRKCVFVDDFVDECNQYQERKSPFICMCNRENEKQTTPRREL